MEELLRGAPHPISAFDHRAVGGQAIRIAHPDAADGSGGRLGNPELDSRDASEPLRAFFLSALPVLTVITGGSGGRFVMVARIDRLQTYPIAYGK